MPAAPNPLRRVVDPRSGLAWVAGGLLLFAQVAAWILATPVFGGPDEPAHTYWAAAVVGGDLQGEPNPGEGPGRAVEVPRSIARLGDPGCFAFEPTIPAGCLGTRSFPGEGPVELVSRAARYPPAYYAVTGLPLLADAGAWSFYGARALSAALAVGLVIVALWAVRHRWDTHLGLGLTVALTPMTLFVFAIINPNALELAAGLGLWLAGAALVRAAGDVAVGRLVAVAGAMAAILALARPASALWVVLTGLVLLVIARGDALRRLTRTRAAWAWALVAALGTAFSVFWLFWSGFLSGATTGEPSGLPSAFDAALIETFLRTDRYVTELFGYFGWLDAPAPSGVPMLWLMLTGVLVLLAVTVGGWRGPVALVGLALAVVLVPAILEARVLGTEGYIWQGRYTLPLAVGVPIVAAVLLQGRPALEPGRRRRLLAWALAIGWFGHAVAFAGTLRRYVVGIDGPYPGLSGPGWRPPVDGRLLTVGLAAVTAAFAGWVWASTREVGRSTAARTGSGA